MLNRPRQESLRRRPQSVLPRLRRQACDPRFKNDQLLRPLSKIPQRVSASNHTRISTPCGYCRFRYGLRSSGYHNSYIIQ